MDNPLMSVILPVYNAGDFEPHCLGAGIIAVEWLYMHTNVCIIRV
jgi:hypothetical protein